ncbi:LpxI family protein [Acetobacter sp.]|uniref:LpxI family protein n=1 Tax=Acetobacter sp. TaxID=440 RepID=UPI0039E9ED2B
MTSAMGAVGILAGGGPLPAKVAEAAHAQGRPVFIIGFDGFADPDIIGPWPHEMVRLGAAGHMLSLLKQHGCTDLVLIGPIRRPSLRSLRPDTEGARVLTRLGRALFAGDDGLLAALVRILAEEGFAVRGAHEFLSHAVAQPGVLGTVQPDALARVDIKRGIEVVQALGRMDIGQGCVVQNGLVLAVEAMEGTDRMIARSGECHQPGEGGVLVKLLKPGQDKRADMPTIGPVTVRAAHAAGLRGIAFEAAHTLMTDKNACIQEADNTGIFLLAVDPDHFQP